MDASILSIGSCKLSYMRTPGERIKEEREALGWSQQKLANEIAKIKKEKISRAAVAQWEGGSSKTQKPDNLFAAAKAMGLSPQWILDETGEKHISTPTKVISEVVNASVLLSEHPDLLAVHRVKFKLSAGVSGYSVEPENGNGKPVFFRKDWFELHNYKPNKLLAVRVSGSSMEPSLWDDDLVVINTEDTKPHDGDVFAINYEGELVIKRMRRDAGEWFACSDNADQRRFSPKRCTEDVQIIGRVVYKQSERI